MKTSTSTCPHALHVVCPVLVAALNRAWLNNATCTVAAQEKRVKPHMGAPYMLLRFAFPLPFYTSKTEPKPDHCPYQLQANHWSF